MVIASNYFVLGRVFPRSEARAPYIHPKRRKFTEAFIPYVPPAINYVDVATVVWKFWKRLLYVDLDTHTGFAIYLQSLFGVGNLDYNAAANIAFKLRESLIYVTGSEISAIAYLLQYNIHIAD